uniref:DH domain-containing protein n=1 Tax=Ciona savignyi TaxID=51511 RepID=H2ZF63_CIOSA
MLSTASNANRVRIRSESKISETIANTDDFSFKEAPKSGNSGPGCRVYLHNSDVIVSNCYLSPPSSPTTVSGIPDDSCDVRSRDSGRPMSLSSVTSTLSSRTSRGSDYFSSASTGENGQVTSYRHGTCDLPNVREIYPEKPSRRVQSCLHDSVREEEEDLNGEAPELPAVKKENGYIKHLTLPRNTNLTSSMKKHNAVSVRDINKKLSEVDHLSPVSTMAMLADPHLTYVDRIILELIETERMFVRALEDVLAGYILAIKNTPELPLSASDVEILFGNIKDIYVFNRQFLSYIENCDNDPVKIAACFVSEDVSFNSYTEYCTSYPGSVAMLTRCMKNPTLADFFKNQQGSLRHSLPLGSYLLKPVQRILKYHLILQELAKYCKKELDGYDIIQQALSTMTFIAHHINEMKRKHEDAVHVQEIQSLLTNWRGDDLTTYGELVMEGTLKLQGAKNERLTFLFDKMILITKRREDGFLVCKVHI